MPLKLNAFRLGDIRGIYPDDIDESFVQAYAHALVGEFGLTGRVAVGRDMRASSESLQVALNEALRDIGIEVVDIGLCPTELGYFASTQNGINAAIVVTASHNPASYNGLKTVLRNGRPITGDHGLNAIRQRMVDGYRHPPSGGSIAREDFHEQYLGFLRQHFPRESLGHARIALNGLNGTAATMAGRIAGAFELPVTWFRKEPGPMPVDGADPANPELAAEMKSFMSGQDFQLGIAWDGDCDRCVCFDRAGDFIPTYYLIGLMVERFLRDQPGRAIVFDTKLCWNTLDMIAKHGGIPVPSETGHAFMKQKMHQHNAVYGGELSSHHYFGDFAGCDSGMFAWMSVLSLLNESPETDIRALIQARREAVQCTPEISVALDDVDEAFASIRKQFEPDALAFSEFDGLSFEMPDDWRFTLRRSKTESLVRVNFEARRSADALLEHAAGILALLETYRSDDKDWHHGLRLM